ncbi:hypothetical protein E5A73_11880 [Sphingomonas gei]|uniref:Uncharacterized protein n=1 Tax=Sphingomonas gei TaxID=1395960 RepID=A0A4S1XC78_9SPHN|nr:hypothetical protein [Sphingomonas gei]TGX53528.1 hypothetical protein E5A73_11880 [Sphingomonas gei]
MASAALVDPAQKWATLRKIDPECWEQVGAGGQGFPIWQLKEDWLRVMFKGAFVAVRAVAGPNMQPIQAVSFAGPDGSYDLRLYSRLRPGEYCDSTWSFMASPGAEMPEQVGHPGRRRLEAPLTDGDAFTAPVNMIWMIDPARIGGQLGPQDFHIRYFCPAIDETIDINAATLEIGYQENQLEKQMKVLPWQRYLFWLGQLRQIDKAAYGRIPKDIRHWIESREGQARIAQLTEQDVGALIQQGMLPPWLAWLSPQEAPQLLESIRLQQGIGRRQDVVQQYAMTLQIPNFSPIPRLLMAIDPARLDPLDLQAFMTIGALRELHGFAEVAQAELIKRRPDLQAAMQSPQGMRQLQGDPEVAALAADPRAQAEQQDQQELLVRRAGNYGPTQREIMIAMQVTSNIQQQQIGMMMMGSNMGMFMGLDSAERYLKIALAEGPPWKLYKPYVC